MDSATQDDRERHSERPVTQSMFQRSISVLDASVAVSRKPVLCRLEMDETGTMLLECWQSVESMSSNASRTTSAGIQLISSLAC